jgi:hypothetical protein
MESDEDEPTAYRKPTAWPLWVSMALWGLPGRGWAWGCFWFSILLALGCIAYGFISWPFFAGAVFFLSAFWYFAAIRWIDQNSEWP